MNPQLAKQFDEADKTMSENGEADRRAETSPENGKKGGRAPIDWGALAEDYMSKTGRIIRWRKEGSYEYNPDTGAYRLLTRAEAEAHAGGFLRGGGASVLYSVNAEKNLAGALRASSDNLHLVPPVFVSTGQSAEGWIAMHNGLLNVEAAARGEVDVLRDHTPDFFSTYALPYDWNPQATCPKFLRFIEEAQPDEEGRAMCQLLAGLLLVPDTSFQVFFVLYGDGGCGKSTYMSILREMLGRENTCRVPLADFADKFKVGNLTTKLANLVEESPTVDGLHNGMASIEGILKEATGGRATMNFEPKGVDADTSRLVTARCVFCQNPPLPPFVDRSEGLWRRLRVIPFPCNFYDTEHPEKVNAGLAGEIIAEELPGVFAWAVRGLGMLRDCKMFPQCTAGAAIVAEHRGTCDRERTFLEAKYCQMNGQYYPIGKVHSAYKSWCQKKGYQPKGEANFKQEVRRVFPGVIETIQRYVGNANKPTRLFLNLTEVAEPVEDCDE